MLYEKIKTAEKYIRTKTELIPRFGLVLGSGLGQLADNIEIEVAIDYGDIPHFPETTVEGHAGKLIFGKLCGVPVVAMAGRFHYYEGYDLREMTIPIRVMKILGATHLILSTAVGATNPNYELGDIVFVNDHINLLPDNPLRGPNDERLGVRFPDMLHAYDKEMIAFAKSVADKNNIRTHEGVYVAMSGPNFETPAEYNFIHIIGGDLAGMSTVPEVIVGKHMGMKIFALAMVTDIGFPKEAIKEITHEEVLKIANASAPKMQLIVEEVIGKFDK